MGKRKIWSKAIISFLVITIVMSAILYIRAYRADDDSAIVLSMEIGSSYYFELHTSHTLITQYGERRTGEHGEFDDVYKKRRKRLTEQEYNSLIEIAEMLYSVDSERIVISDAREVEVVYKEKIHNIIYDMGSLGDQLVDELPNHKYAYELIDLFIKYSPIPIVDELPNHKYVYELIDLFIKYSPIPIDIN